MSEIFLPLLTSKVASALNALSLFESFEQGLLCAGFPFVDDSIRANTNAIITFIHYFPSHSDAAHSEHL